MTASRKRKDSGGRGKKQPDPDDAAVNKRSRGDNGRHPLWNEIRQACIQLNANREDQNHGVLIQLVETVCGVLRRDEAGNVLR